VISVSVISEAGGTGASVLITVLLITDYYRLTAHWDADTALVSSPVRFLKTST
jgi:hypothetical protein